MTKLLFPSPSYTATSAGVLTPQLGPLGFEVLSSIPAVASQDLHVQCSMEELLPEGTAETGQQQGATAISSVLQGGVLNRCEQLSG